MHQTKVCLHCAKRKAVSKFYVRANPSQSGPNRGTTVHRPECKACTKARRARVARLRSKTRIADQNQSPPAKR